MAPPSLEPGDRFPDFVRPDPDGRAAPFYDVRCGRPTLVIVGRPPSVAVQALVRREIPPADIVVVTDGPPEERVGDLLYLVDGDRAVIGALGGMTAGTEPGFTWFVLRPTLHVARCGHATDLPADAIAAAWHKAAQPPPPAAAANLAPVLIVPDVLDGDHCRTLIEAFDAGTPVESGMPRLVGSALKLVPDPTAKVRRDLTLADGPLAQAVIDRLARRVLPEIRKAFYYPVTRFEALKLVCYDAASSGYFRRHRDNTTPDAAHRRFALTLNLNTGAYDGGGLVFPEFGPQSYAPPAGGAIVFSCAHLHEVKDVTRGRRFAVISFLYGDQDRRRPATG